jgi:lysine 2,3-aminomutase
MSAPFPKPHPDAALTEVAKRYAVAITPTMAGLLDPSEPADPIGAQFLPDARELEITPQELADPIGDATHSPLPWIVHRYADRLLLKMTHVCPLYCRFCFRREMVGPGKARGLKPGEMAAALDYIQTRTNIWEVILTGGDPFVLSTRRIKAVTQALAAIEHVAVLRWHTRVPVVAPELVTPSFVRALKAPGKAVYVALHANHVREFTPEARAAIARLVDAGIPLLSQTVLLKGVNDTPAALEALMRMFVANRVKPYYLHHGDLAPGTGHFRTGIAEGQELIRTLKVRASGLCQPTYVLDIPGGHGKAPLTPIHWRDGDVLDDSGCWRAYPPKGQIE